MERRDNLIVRRGVGFAYGWPVVDEQGQPQDMSGWTVRSQVRASYGDTAPLLFEFTAHGRADGMVIIEATPAQTADWAWRRGVYDVIAATPDGARVGWVGGGSIRVDPRVTR